MRTFIHSLVLASCATLAVAAPASATEGGSASATTQPAPIWAGDMGDVSKLRDPSFYTEKAKVARALEFLDIDDPLEPLNRRIYAFNRLFDQYIYLPVVNGYRYVTPDFVEERVQRFFANVAEIRNLVGALLQGNLDKTARSGGRLVVNSTVGILGLFDVASTMGIEKVNEDVGQAFGRWGISRGPYLVLPILGPSNLRDTVGLVGDNQVIGGLNLFGVPEEEWQSPWLFGLYAINERANVNFRYGQLRTAFEYDLVRYLSSKHRKLLIAE